MTDSRMSGTLKRLIITSIVEIVIGLALFGLLTFIFAMTEPMFRKIFSFASFDPLLVVVEAGSVVISFLMLVFAVLEWLGRRRRPV